MAVNQANLFFSRGDTYTFSCLAQDYSQAVINLTGAAITFTAKRTPADSVALFTRTIGTGITVTSASLGTFTVAIAPANTSSLPDYPQVLVYDIAVTVGGAITSVQSGSIYLSPNV